MSSHSPCSLLFCLLGRPARRRAFPIRDSPARPRRYFAPTSTVIASIRALRPRLRRFLYPGCGHTQYQFHNPIWFGFIASTTTITMQIVASNCMGGNNGIQAGIYDNCISSPMDLQCACSNNFQLTANNFVRAKSIGFLLTGVRVLTAISSIDVTVGSTAGVTPADPGPITGPITVCANSTTSYSITPIFAATNYAWTVTPAIGTPSGTNPSTNITWSPTASGTANVRNGE